MITAPELAVLAALRALIVSGRWPSGRAVTRKERTWILNEIRATEKAGRRNEP